MMKDILEVLKELKIEYKIVEHEAVYTVEEAEAIKTKIAGIGCKNLFLKHNKDYYLYVLRDDKRADLKDISSKLNLGRLSFSSEEELKEKLKLTRGAVTPMGIINDNASVKLIIDKDLKDNYLLVHPNRNTATISISFDDLIKFINQFQNDYYLV